MPRFKDAITAFGKREAPTALKAHVTVDGEREETKPPTISDMLAVGLGTSEIAAVLGTSTAELEELIKMNPALCRKWDESRAYRRFEIQQATHEIALGPTVDPKASIAALKMLREELADQPFIPFGAAGKAQVNSTTGVVAVAAGEIKKKLADRAKAKRAESGDNASDSSRR